MSFGEHGQSFLLKTFLKVELLKPSTRVYLVLIDTTKQVSKVVQPI